MLHKRERESISQFDEWAPGYDHSVWSRYFNSGYKAALDCVASHIGSHSNILDIGCGTGALELLLSERVTHGAIVAMDISPQMILEARKKSRAHIKNAVFVTSTANSLPLQSDSFDAVFVLNALHHFPDHEGFFQEASRVMKRSGRLVILDLIVDSFVRRAWTEAITLTCAERDVEFHSRQGIRDLGSKAHLRVEAQRTFWYFTAISVLKRHR